MIRWGRQRTKQGILIATSLVLVIALLLIACGGGEGEVKKVKIGLGLSFTGPMASATAPISEGMLAYLKYVNDQGGIEYKDPNTGETQKALLDIDWEDNLYAADKAISVYKRQAARGCVLHETIVAGPVYAEQARRTKVPVFYGGDLATGIMEAQPRYVSALRAASIDRMFIFVEWASKQQEPPPKIALLALDIPEFKSAASGGGLTEELVSQYGGELVGVERVPATATDMTIELTRLKEANPDWIMLQLVPSSIAIALKDAQRIGIPESVKFLSVSVFDETLISLLGDLSEGLHGLLFWSLTSDTDIPGVQLAHDVMSTYYNRSATLTDLWGIMISMVSVGAIQKALNEVGVANVTPSIVNDALSNLSDFDAMGLTLPVTMTEDYPVALHYVRVSTIEGGAVKAVSDWLETPRIGPTLK